MTLTYQLDAFKSINQYSLFESVEETHNYIALVCSDDAKYHQRVHRLLVAVLCRPPDPHLVRVSLLDRRLRLRLGRDTSVVQQRYQPSPLRLLQRPSQARSSRGLLPSARPTTGS